MTDEHFEMIYDDYVDEIQGAKDLPRDEFKRIFMQEWTAVVNRVFSESFASSKGEGNIKQFEDIAEHAVCVEIPTKVEESVQLWLQENKN